MESEELMSQKKKKPYSKSTVMVWYDHSQGHVNEQCGRTQTGTCKLFHSSIIHKSQKLKATYHTINSAHNVVSSHGEILPAHKQQ